MLVKVLQKQNLTGVFSAETTSVLSQLRSLVINDYLPIPSMNKFSHHSRMSDSLNQLWRFIGYLYLLKVKLGKSSLFFFRNL